MESYFCFTDYINTYPNLDFLDKDHAHRKASTEQMIKDDRYAQLIESLWLELDVEREKCCCHACTEEYCKIDCTNCTCNVWVNFHRYFYHNDCEKIIRQRLKKRDYRTCRFCQKDIPKDEFEEEISSYEHDFSRLHMNPCAEKHGFLTFPSKSLDKIDKKENPIVKITQGLG